MFVGSLILVKDPITLVKAIDKIIETQNNIHLEIVGKGELYNEIKCLIDKLGISNNVKLVGQLKWTDLILHYNASDLFVLPSLGEGCPLVLLEAMAFGLPVLTSNIATCSEVISDAGTFFKVGDYLDLSKKIIELSKNKEALEKMSKKGLNRVTYFSRDTIINKYCKLYVSAYD